MLQPQGKLCVEAVLGGQNPAQLLQAIQDQGLQVGWGGGGRASTMDQVTRACSWGGGGEVGLGRRGGRGG